MNSRYLMISEHWRQQYGEKVYKLPVSLPVTCPNRDGREGMGGCTYCNNQTFSPEYCKPTKTITQQIEEGIEFFKKYESQIYLAYFQSYTNTYDSLDKLKAVYEEALAHPKVVGLVVGTRPDCVNDEILDYFAELSKRCYVMVEYGIESTENKTLEFINDFKTKLDKLNN